MGGRRLALWMFAVAATTGCGSSSNPADTTPQRGVPSSRLEAEQRDLVGRKAPNLEGLPWLEPGRSDVKSRGRVTFVRFFTDTCPFCRTTAPALAELHEEFGARGLQVIGIYHPKPRGRPVSRPDVQRFVNEHGWTFTVGIDEDWALMDAFWPPDDGRRYTSFSMLIDRDGVIRYVHPGPEFHPSGCDGRELCRADFEDIRAGIATVLAESQRRP